MERPVRGDVVVVPFPFSISETFKRRPALVIASWPYRNTHDYLLCCITSQATGDSLASEIVNEDFAEGSLKRTSFVRPLYLYSADLSMIHGKKGSLKKEKLDAVTDSIVQFIQ